MQKHADDEYLNAILENDVILLRDYLRDFYPSIRSFVVNNSGTEEDARDIFGDVTEVLLRKLSSGPFILTCKLNTFLTEVGARLWLKKLRRRKYNSGVTTDDPVVLKYMETISKPMEQTERFALYRNKFNQLEKPCKNVLRMGIQEGKSHEEVMKVTGHSYAYSRKIRAKCLKKLIEMIKSDSRYEELKFQRSDVH